MREHDGTDFRTMRATTLRHLRLALNAFLEDAALITRTIATFRPTGGAAPSVAGPLEQGSVGPAG